MEIDQCFHAFKKWSGTVQEGYWVNFLGAKGKDEYFIMDLAQPPSPSGLIQTQYPQPDEEYFEWVDLLESVLSAKDEFTFVELGAGFGRWSVNAALAASQRGKKYRILAVEAEPTHFAWLKENIIANGLDPGRCELVEAAVAKHEGEAEFYIGNPGGWYGQSLESVAKGYSAPGVNKRKVKTVTLDQCLERFATVDLIDMDIQYAELEVLKASRMLDKRVRRVHIETHNYEIEAGLRELFRERRSFLGGHWTPRFDFSIGERMTPVGLVKFQGGVQTWMKS